METFSALLALRAENSPVPGEFTAQRPVTRSFDVFFDLCLNKRLSKQSWGWWFETQSGSLWRHCNGMYLSTSVRKYDYIHDDVIKWQHFPRYWPSVRGIHRSNKRLTKQSRGWWFETLWCPLWRHCNAAKFNVLCSSISISPVSVFVECIPF